MRAAREPWADGRGRGAPTQRERAEAEDRAAQGIIYAVENAAWAKQVRGALAARAMFGVFTVLTTGKEAA